MDKQDFEVTVSVKNGEFSMNAAGSVPDAVKGMLLGVASLMETAKYDNVTDRDLDAAIPMEYRNAVAFVRENKDDADAFVAEFE